MRTKDLTNNYGARLSVSKQEDPEREIKRGDKVLIETLKNGTKRYAEITGNSPTSWRVKEEKPSLKQQNESIW